MDINILLPLQRGNQASKGKNSFKIPEKMGCSPQAGPAVILPGLSHCRSPQSSGRWRDGTLEKQQMAKTAHNLQGKREKHQQELTRICGGEKKPDFFLATAQSQVFLENMKEKQPNQFSIHTEIFFSENMIALLFISFKNYYLIILRYITKLQQKPTKPLPQGRDLMNFCCSVPHVQQ